MAHGHVVPADDAAHTGRRKHVAQSQHKVSTVAGAGRDEILPVCENPCCYRVGALRVTDSYANCTCITHKSSLLFGGTIALRPLRPLAYYRCTAQVGQVMDQIARELWEAAGAV